MAHPTSIHATAGSHSLTLFTEEQTYLAAGTQPIALLSQLAMSHGAGATLTDMDGRDYIDLHAGATVASLGHAHPRLTEALEIQLRRLIVGNFTTLNRRQLLELIASITPAELNKTQFYSGGAEAIDAAFRLAQAHTDHDVIVGCRGGFHGKTGRAAKLLSTEVEPGKEPAPHGDHLLPYADCYRCPFELEYPSCGLACLDFARQSIRDKTAGQLAAIVIEPMQGNAGNVVPPPEFLPGIQSIAQDVGALLIVDEILTGFGRTGMMFACEHTGVVPDIMAIGKGMGGGFPVSGVVSTAEIFSSPELSKPGAASSTYGGNPLAATAALTTIQTIIDDRLVDHAATIGEMMYQSLLALQEKYEFIGNVSGIGLLLGLDLVKDRATKEPLSRSVTQQIFHETLRRGLLVMDYFHRVRINPPLVISAEQAQEGIAILDDVFAYVQQHIDYKHG